MKKDYKVYFETEKKVSPYLNKKDTILEIACGSGQLTGLLANKVKTITATDFSPKMIEQAKKRLKAENINFSVADATHLSYETKTFDAVIIANALHIIPNPEKVLEEISRVLKKNGKLISTVFIEDKDLPKFRLWFLKKIGFKTYHNWNKDSFLKFLKSNKFSAIDSIVIKANSLAELIVISTKKEQI